jgi:4-amino-4-deoxy-L-arabinose transferase-like glycosyltransferase
MMALLGINKQLDLQSWFTQLGRDFALAQGWYVHRQAVQAAFIVALTLAIFAMLFWLQRATRGFGGEIRWACLGLVLVTLFVLMRAASFHHVDSLLHQEFGSLRINWIMELGGIGCIGAAAVARLRRVAGS